MFDYHSNYELILPKTKYESRGLSGLINLGNKCFMNSILQCLSNSLQLTDYFLSKKFIEESKDYNNRRKPEYHIVSSYVNLLENIWESNQLLKPKSFVENISKFIKKYYNLTQQDSHECLMYVLDLLHKGLSYELNILIQGEVLNKQDQLMKESLETWKKHYEKSHSYIVDVFNGMFYNKISCSSCEFTENIFEPYNCISLDCQSNLIQCLDNSFIENEIVQSWKCDKCNNYGCIKDTKLWTLPNTIIIHLKRFTTDGKKNNSHIDFPLEDLNLTKYISTDKNDKNHYIYSLYAINYHSGTANSGHYWSACKNLNNNWYLFNDGNVSKFHNINDLLTKDAYILFYHRKFIKQN
jgi:ubiquitin carboxyl-terminal hydrolase 8